MTLMRLWPHRCISRIVGRAPSLWRKAGVAAPLEASWQRHQQTKTAALGEEDLQEKRTEGARYFASGIYISLLLRIFPPPHDFPFSPPPLSPPRLFFFVLLRFCAVAIPSRPLYSKARRHLTFSTLLSTETRICNDR